MSQQLKIGSTVIGILVSLILVGSTSVVSYQQQASAFGFVERQQIGEFKKLTGEFVQNVINSQRSPNSEGVGQFRMLTAQFERDIINVVLNDQLFLIPGLVSQYEGTIFETSPPLGIGAEIPRQDLDGYTQEVLRIFCRPCV